MSRGWNEIMYVKCSAQCLVDKKKNWSIMTATNHSCQNSQLEQPKIALGRPKLNTGEQHLDGCLKPVSVEQIFKRKTSKFLPPRFSSPVKPFTIFFQFHLIFFTTIYPFSYQLTFELFTVFWTLYEHLHSVNIVILVSQVLPNGLPRWLSPWWPESFRTQ